VSDNSAAGTFSFFISTTPFLEDYFRFVVFGGLFTLAMSSTVFVCQLHLCLGLVVPRAVSRDQHAAVKWCATNPQLELESVKRLDHRFEGSKTITSVLHCSSARLDCPNRPR